MTIPEGTQTKVKYLASVERFKLLQTTVPGDRIIMEARIGRAMPGLASHFVRAHVGTGTSHLVPGRVAKGCKRCEKPKGVKTLQNKISKSQVYVA